MTSRTVGTKDCIVLLLVPEPANACIHVSKVYKYVKCINMMDHCRFLIIKSCTCIKYNNYSKFKHLQSTLAYCPVLLLVING